MSTVEKNEAAVRRCIQEQEKEIGG